MSSGGVVGEVGQDHACRTNSHRPFWLQAGRAEYYGCFMSLMEVYYRVWKDESGAAARLAYEQYLSLPIEWLRESPELLEAAAAISQHRLLRLCGPS